MNRLNDKVALITGANTRIGAAAAKLFADEGAQVIASSRSGDGLQALADEIRDDDGEILCIACDMTKPEEISRMFETISEQFGSLDVLVNLAGISPETITPIEQTTESDIDRILSVNLKGTFLITQKAIEVMKDNDDGSIIFISSLAGDTGAGSAAMALAEGGVSGLAKHTAIALSHSGIRSNTVCAPRQSLGINNGSRKPVNPSAKAIASHVDLDAEASLPDDVANICLFLASDESRSLTGEVLVADFGSTL